MIQRIFNRFRSQKAVQRLTRDERGLSTVEYVILMAVVVVGAIGLWNEIGTKFKEALGSSKSEVEGLGVKESESGLAN
jgi:Flp pilus assembly pilin Flp